MTKVRTMRVAAAVMVTAAIGTVIVAAGCTSTPASRPSPPPSTPSPECTGRDGEAVLRAFFHDLSNHRDVTELLSAYVAPSEVFVRWWDPSLQPGEVVSFFNGLPEHLEKLQRDGIDLTVTGFKDVGFSGRGTIEAGGWPNFGLDGRLRSGDPVHPVSPGSDGEHLGNKGAVDCATGKLKVIVL